MDKLYITKLSIEECKKRLNENLKGSVFGYWWEDVFVGKVTDNTFEFYFHKAYMRNSFSKKIKGKFYTDNNKNFVSAKITSFLFSPRIYLIIFSITTILCFLEQLSDGFKYGILDYIGQVLFFFIPCSLFLLFMGIAANSSPSGHKEKVLVFLEKALELEEVICKK